LKDEDWDSDAENAGGGSWVKGEWVPEVKKKEKWWEKGKNLKKSEQLLPSSGNQQDDDSKPFQENIDDVLPFKAVNKYDIVVLDPNFTFHANSNGVTSPDKKKASKVDNNDDDDDDINNSPFFVKAMIQLVESAEAYAAAQPLFTAAKQEIMTAQAESNETKLLLKNAKMELEKEIFERSETENDLIRDIKQGKHLRKQIITYKNKVRISRLLNHVTPLGHTAVSWAASYGNYAVVEELLSHGSTVGYNEDLVNLSVSFIQLSYRIYRFIHSAKTELNAKMMNLNSSLERG
jgi:hypothetical protein